MLLLLAVCLATLSELPGRVLEPWPLQPQPVVLVQQCKLCRGTGLPGAGTRVPLCWLVGGCNC